jgi:hypothetical protein
MVGWMGSAEYNIQQASKIATQYLKQKIHVYRRKIATQYFKTYNKLPFILARPFPASIESE